MYSRTFDLAIKSRTWAESDSPNFVSYLPISLDASASGWQHLSLLSIDRKGAELTNLLSGEHFYDLYGCVAQELMKEVLKDAQSGTEAAQSWLAIDRKTVKSGVMTTPYGSTRQGKRDQLLDYIYEAEEKGQDFPDAWKSANYLAEKLDACVYGMFRQTKEVKDWLCQITRFCVKELAQCVTWVTPSGFPVVMEEYVKKERKVKFTCYLPAPDGSADTKIVGEYVVVIANEENGLDLSELQSQIAPNYVHSLDSAHLVLTVNHLWREGLRHFSVIHDSYGVHACDVPLMVKALKEKLVILYQDPLLENFLDAQLSAARSQGIDEQKLERLQALQKSIPRGSSFEIKDILHSKYMFS